MKKVTSPLWSTYGSYTVLDKMLEIFSEKLDEHGIVIDDLVV